MYFILYKHFAIAFAFGDCVQTDSLTLVTTAYLAAGGLEGKSLSQVNLSNLDLCLFNAHTHTLSIVLSLSVSARTRTHEHTCTQMCPRTTRIHFAVLAR